MCGLVLKINSGNKIVLSKGQKWRLVNTRLLLGSEVEKWNQNWEVDFAENYDRSTFNEQSEGGTHLYYKASNAFSPAFKEFSRDLIIDDEADEDQCRNARELLGFDRDHSLILRFVILYLSSLFSPVIHFKCL